MKNASKNIAITIALALPLLVGACAPTRTSDSTGQYIDDSAITAKVKTAILDDATLKVMQIDVTTDKRTVHLHGTVDSPQTVAHAGDVARNVAGVTSVQNDLIVR